MKLYFTVLILTLILVLLPLSSANAKTIALWLCDEGDGKILKDSSGNGHDGELQGKTSWAEGMFGKALEFHDNPDLVFVEGSKDLTGPDAMTVEMWLKAPMKAGYHIPISKGLKGAGHWEIYLLAGAGKFSTYIPDLGDFTGTNVVTDDQWHHCAMVWDGSAIKLYVDGKMVDEKGGLKGKKIVADDQKLHIGNEFTNNNWHTGLLDEIRISDEALEVGELGFNKSLAQLAVDVKGKLSTTWGQLKYQDR